MRENIQQLARPGRHKWRQALAFGLPLALLELGVLAAFYTNYEVFQPLWAIPVGLLFYLVVSAIAGYWFGRQDGQKGSWAGLRAGLVGAVTFLVVLVSVFTFLWIRYINIPRFRGEWGFYDPSWYLSLLTTALALFAALNAGGVLLSALGGWLGGLVAHWRPQSREQFGEQQA